MIPRKEMSKMGCIYRRRKTYWVKYYRNGKAYAESSHSDKLEIAKRILKVREGEISQGKMPGICFDKIKFNDLCDDFLNDYRVNGKKSLVRAERSVNHLKVSFDGARVTNITTPRINAYIQMRLDEEAANATVNRELAALKRIFNLAARQTPPKVDRVPYIPMLKENNVRKGFFEHGDFLKLRAALPEYLQGFVTFAYKTGWRVSEIESLTRTQVDLPNGIVRLEVGDTKNDEGRTVYLDEELQKVFQRQEDARKERTKIIPHVFTNESGSGPVKDFRGAWATACETAEIGKRLFHDFRRTAVRNMVRAGIPERVAMMISGHKTRSVFDRYNIVSDADLKIAASKQEAYLKTQMVTLLVTVSDFEAKRKKAGAN
jgi:integrase